MLAGPRRGRSSQQLSISSFNAHLTRLLLRNIWVFFLLQFCMNCFANTYHCKHCFQTSIKVIFSLKMALPNRAVQTKHIFYDFFCRRGDVLRDRVYIFLISFGCLHIILVVRLVSLSLEVLGRKDWMVSFIFLFSLIFNTRMIFYFMFRHSHLFGAALLFKRNWTVKIPHGKKN